MRGLLVATRIIVTKSESLKTVLRYFKYLRLFFESMDALPKQKRKLWRGLSVDLHKNPQLLG